MPTKTFLVTFTLREGEKLTAEDVEDALLGRALKPDVKEVALKEYSCGYCKFEGVVSETSDWTRCPNCGAV